MASTMTIISTTLVTLHEYDQFPPKLKMMCTRDHQRRMDGVSIFILYMCVFFRHPIYVCCVNSAKANPLLLEGSIVLSYMFGFGTPRCFVHIKILCIFLLCFHFPLFLRVMQVLSYKNIALRHLTRVYC